MFYSHTDAVHEYNAVINVLRHGGLYRVKADNQRWTLLWSTHPSPAVLRSMTPSQRTNHFPGSWHLGRKDWLWRCVARMQRTFGRDYQIMPQSFILPRAMPTWEQARSSHPEALWIWKPCRQSCGRGIKIFSSDISLDEAKELWRKRGIVQRYISDPLLIDGYKFDLRIYVVVLSYDPLKVYINDEGLVRLATERYSAKFDTLENRTMHLTNYSINKASPSFVQNRDGQDGGRCLGRCDSELGEASPPSKWSLRELRAHFRERGIDYDAVIAGIKDIVVKTLIAAEPPIRTEWARALGQEGAGWSAQGPDGGAHSSSSCSCFEIYGFDIIVDEALKPWLLEVNICPSLSSGSPLDKRIKTKLVADTLTLVGIQPPPSLWRRSRASMKRPSIEVAGAVFEDTGCAEPAVPSSEEVAKRAANIASFSNAIEALAQFDELAWETVLKLHEEDMRRGGLERIYPAINSSRYSMFFAEESYLNLVLRRWHEAGGSELLSRIGAPRDERVPPWVPRQVCFATT